MKIYFATDGSRIKVGISRDVEARLLQLAQHFPKPLKLLGSISGSTDLERAAHAAMKEFHIRGEWFSDNPAARVRVNGILSDPAILEPFKPIRKSKPVFVPTDAPPERRRAAMLFILNAMWPDDHIGELVALSGATPEAVQRWLSGEEEMPLLVAYSLRGLFTSFFAIGTVETFK